MEHLHLTLSIFLSFLMGVMAKSTQYLPRMIFTDKDTAVKRLSLSGHHAPVKIIPQRHRDAVIAVGQQEVILYDFQKTPVEQTVLWHCGNTSAAERSQDCRITVFQEMNETDLVFVCVAADAATRCCQMNVSSASPSCTSPSKVKKIVDSMKSSVTAKVEPSILVESGDSSSLYVTRSGQENSGIYRFGEKVIKPSNQNKEQHFVGLMFNRRKDDPLQNKVYAFYKARNCENHPQSYTWTPFVTQVCMADVGGSKSKLQRKWTSQMNAKLFCGNADTKQSFSELVDVAVVQAARWQDTRVYGLFRNEWGMSAVCVYTIQDIDDVFKNSKFKGSTKAFPLDRKRECVEDSTKLPYETLDMIERTSEMEQWVQPRNKSGPILINLHHNYTHIHVDTSQHMMNSNQAVLFITLNNGAIHKVIHREGEVLVGAEYQVFTNHVHILSISLQTSCRRLVVASNSELVHLDVENCGKYGDSCDECVLAKDPYCSWDNNHCVPHTHEDVQNGTAVDFDICPLTVKTGKDDIVQRVTLPYGSRYFLQCPVTSRHAVYRWNHLNKNTNCSVQDQSCFLHIDHVGPKDAGTYTCESEELGYVKVRAKYDLWLESRAGTHRSGWLPWVGVVVLLVKSLFC
ncbi:semaphorin-7A isoform X2 [Cynoglossus semilaevis]|uniref:Semaphorin-7A-like n=1 Tax=Cynoglossus semilaevis TaxID=244447 RepID=A0A3P8VPL5_CYNSE|nr:semaphorin-7A-like isoform X2 [Cynoglossus semilaevis]